MSKNANALPDQPESWTWPEERWRPIVEKIRAGRSLKPSTWPNGARCAVALSFDSDHETQVLRWGQSSPGKLSQGEFGSRVGVPRILKLLEKYEAPSTFFVPAVVAMLHPEEQRAVIDRGHEIGIHSWIHELNSTLPPENERELQMRAADKLEEICGVRPVGIRTPSWDFSEHTLSITREMGLIYDSSLMADDDPYEIMEENQPS
ncbi:MAG: polysaccharide deacetylase family protein, partial [Paracoccaceae bacterium]